MTNNTTKKQSLTLFTNQWDNWDWVSKLPVDEFHQQALKKYPGWDKIGDSVPFVMLQIGETDKSSRNVSIEFDDLAQGYFYCRDWTSSGLPFIEEGDIYWSGFWFQSMSDAVRFREIYGGTAIWEPSHKEIVALMNNNRG